MEQADRETIKRKNVILSKEMDFVGVTSGLIARRIFENHHIESFSSERSKREKNMALLMEIETRGPRAFDCLVESLIEANQEHLAQELARYSASGSSQGQMGQAKATTPHENKPALFDPPTQQVPPVWPARDGTGDYSSTPMDALGYSSTTMDALGYSSTPMDALGSYPQTKVDSTGSEYRMKSIPKGIAVVMNNRNFNTTLKLGRELKERKGTDVDGDKLQNMFIELQFEVYVHNDCTGRKIEEIIEQLRKDNHSRYDCFIIAILSHGEKGDAIYGTDGDIVTLEYIMDQFGANRCPTLSGKPKLFFVQACRGGKLDEGVTVNAVDGADSSAPTRKMPCQSDMFLAYSTVPGYVSWRNAKGGSWFVQALTDVIPPLARSMDLGTMMTRVNDKLSRDFESDDEEKYKQISAGVNMLTKDLYFFSKQERENLT